ncbi:hypothetical protein [Nocardia sp. NPDC058666]|uniref:hypothetical protein n=1 Tax=Nocardia sp. NPDC058666 TaxID=3346587 RepID=UPI0036564C3B
MLCENTELEITYSVPYCSFDGQFGAWACFLRAVEQCAATRYAAIEQVGDG